MSGMNPERLADIRERHSAGLGLERPGDVAALLAEVKRLRAIEAGAERLCHRWRGSTNPALHMERDLRALLNPTEGDDHE